MFLSHEFETEVMVRVFANTRYSREPDLTEPKVLSCALVADVVVRVYLNWEPDLILLFQPWWNWMAMTSGSHHVGSWLRETLFRYGSYPNGSTATKTSLISRTLHHDQEISYIIKSKAHYRA